MRKRDFLIVGFSILIMGGCMKSEVKTEITVQLSENEYLYAKYTGYFDISQGRTIETASPQLISELRLEMEPSKEEAVIVLAKRIESAAVPVKGMAGIFNKVETNWMAADEPNTYTITINREVDEERVHELLGTTADGGFWETYEAEEVFTYFNNINTLLRDKSITDGLNIMTDTNEFAIENPLFMILQPSVRQDGTFYPGSTIGLANVKDTALLNAIFSLPPVSMELPYNLKLLWSLKPQYGSEDFFALHAIKVNTRDGKPLLDCESIVEASVNDESYPPTVEIVMNAEGAKIWARITSENIGRNIAFVMNNTVYFSPRVSSEISEGRSVISADFEEDEAENLAIILGSGYLPPFGVKVVEIR